MGFRVCLVAVSGKPAELIHREFGVSPTEQFEEFPEAPVAGAAVPGGAYVLYINDGHDPDKVLLVKLSQDASLVACTVNETVMCSSVCCWANGVEQWSVTHDTQHGIMHLKTTGRPPDPLKEIRERLLASQATDKNVDFMFDIPVELFVTMGGIRYDQDIPGVGPNHWQILTRTAAKKKSWWPFG